MPLNFFKRQPKSEAKSKSGATSEGLTYPGVFHDGPHTFEADYNSSQRSRSAAEGNNAQTTYVEYKETPRAKKKPDADDPFAFLGDFDTVFLIDDSSSMVGDSWGEVMSALEAIVPVCTKYDADGIDIYFLNKNDSRKFHNITTPDAVKQIFQNVEPSGSTNTGNRLDAIMKPHLDQLEKCKKRGVIFPRPLNIIVITDGAPTDDPEAVIVEAAKRLDAAEAPAWQIGIQFFQVGGNTAAGQSLVNLDDNLKKKHLIRDMVDTLPWEPERALNSDFILKAVTGAVIRRHDRRTVS